MSHRIEYNCLNISIETHADVGLANEFVYRRIHFTMPVTDGNTVGYENLVAKVAGRRQDYLSCTSQEILRERKWRSRRASC